jgi:predicted RNase H-like HicB family nuclease
MEFTGLLKSAPGLYWLCRRAPRRQHPRRDPLEEARANLKEAVALVLEANRTLAEEALKGQDVIRDPWS